MDHQYSHHIKLSQLTDARDVLAQLAKLNMVLPDSDLAELTPFNNAYYIITNAVINKLNAGEFEQPTLVQQLDICFARYYFDALNHYTLHKTMPVVWHKAAFSTSRNSKPAFISLLVGANAHINHDLPLALAETISSPSQIENDFFATESIFVNSGYEIIHSFREKNALLNYAKNGTQFIYKKPTIMMILKWRRNAWQNYLDLSNGALAYADLAAMSTKTANQILSFSNAFSTN